MGGPAVTYPSTAASLAYRGRGGGREESDDDVEAAEVWPLMGRGVPHVRVKRKNGEVASGRAGSEAGSGGVVDLQSDVQDACRSPYKLLFKIFASVLERFKICRTSSIPASPANDYRSVKEDEDAGDVPFREVVGSLMWIANQTRPDISNAVRAVARHSHEPKKSHWKAAQKILNYLLETAHLVLVSPPRQVYSFRSRSKCVRMLTQQAMTYTPFCPCLIGLPHTRSGSPLTSSIPLPVMLRAV